MKENVATQSEYQGAEVIVALKVLLKTVRGAAELFEPDEDGQVPADDLSPEQLDRLHERLFQIGVLTSVAHTRLLDEKKRRREREASDNEPELPLTATEKLAAALTPRR